MTETLTGLDPDVRYVTARQFVGARVTLRRRDVFGTHEHTGQVQAVARMPWSGQTHSVLVLSTETGDVALSLATVVSIATDGGQ